jgi:hypothetical protein
MASRSYASEGFVLQPFEVQAILVEQFDGAAAGRTHREQVADGSVFLTVATSEPASSSIDRMIRSGAFRHARCYAPAPVMEVLGAAATASVLALAIDVDALERSALARVDRVMILALQALSRAQVQIVLLANDEQERAARLQLCIAGSWCARFGERDLVARLRQGSHGARVIAISDDADLLASLDEADCGIALGRPELAKGNIAVAGDTAIRATLWWLLEARARGIAA